MKQFKDKYDRVQEQLQNLAVMDDFLAGKYLCKYDNVECKYIQLLLQNVGMLSKSLGQIIRVALSLHILFYVDKDDPDIPDVVSSEAITAAIDFVELCCQQTAYLAGRGDISVELQRLQEGFACKVSNCYSRLTYRSDAVPNATRKRPTSFGTIDSQEISNPWKQRRCNTGNAIP